MTPIAVGPGIAVEGFLGVAKESERRDAARLAFLIACASFSAANRLLKDILAIAS